MNLHSLVKEENMNSIRNNIRSLRNQINTFDVNARSPLMYAIEKDNVEIMKYLLWWNADINAKNKFGNTPLHIAVGKPIKKGNEYVKQRKTIITLLTYRRLNKDLKNNDGKTAENYAGDLYNIEFAQIITNSKYIMSETRIKYSDKHLAMYMQFYNTWKTVKYGELIGLASLTVTHKIVQMIPVKIWKQLIFIRGYDSNDYQIILEFKRLSLNQMIKVYTPLLKASIKNVSLQTKRQWPHLPFIFLKSDSIGSCVDVALKKLMKYSDQGKPFKIHYYTGYNAPIISHVELDSAGASGQARQEIDFIILSLFHTYRMLQIANFVMRDRKIEKKIIKFISDCLYLKTQSKYRATRLFNFITNRKQSELRLI